MRIHTSIGTILVSWHHRPDMGNTVCDVALMERHTEVYGWGIARRRPEDQQNPIKGRKLSLARALRASGVSRFVRTEVWCGLLSAGFRVEENAGRRQVAKLRRRIAQLKAEQRLQTLRFRQIAEQAHQGARIEVQKPVSTPAIPAVEHHPATPPVFSPLPHDGCVPMF